MQTAIYGTIIAHIINLTIKNNNLKEKVAVKPQEKVTKETVLVEFSI